MQLFIVSVLYLQIVLFFEKITEDSQKEFFKGALDYLKNKIGEEFIISANVHLDETTPHMHVGFVPIIDNSLSAKKLIDRKLLRTYLADAEKEEQAARRFLAESELSIIGTKPTCI